MATCKLLIETDGVIQSHSFENAEEVVRAISYELVREPFIVRPTERSSSMPE